MPKLVFLATDIVLYLLLAVIALYVWYALRVPTLRQTWRTVVRDPSAMSAAVVLGGVPGDLRARLDPLSPAAAPGSGRGRRCRAGLFDANAVAPRRAADRTARFPREDLLGAAGHASVFEGIDAGRRQDRSRLSAPEVRRRPPAGRRSRVGARHRPALGHRDRRRRARRGRALGAGRRAARAVLAGRARRVAAGDPAAAPPRCRCARCC